jgi:hypothetical protein
MNTNPDATKGRPAAHGGPGAYVNYFGGSSLGYGFVDNGPVKPPKCPLNGGLYTGEPFVAGAAYGNVATVADADYMTNVNLRSANPPPEALYQYASFLRPGNNYVQQPGVGNYSQQHEMKCIKEVKPAVPCVCKSECDCHSCNFTLDPVKGYALYHK